MSPLPSLSIVDDDEGITRLFTRGLSGKYPLAVFALTFRNINPCLLTGKP
jgi:hypothetical protein